MKVILDTNFLIYCANMKVDYKHGIDNLVNGDYEIVVPIQVLRELADLRDKSKKVDIRLGARLAIRLLHHNGIDIIKTRGKTADSAILKLSKKNIIATLDREIRDKAKRVITVSRNRKMRLME